MNITSDKPYMVFVKEYEGKNYYKISLSRKKQDGTYENGYIDVRFKGNVSINNKDQIYIKNAFLTFYKNKDKATIPYIMIMEYEPMSEAIEHSKETDVQKNNDKDLFEEFGEEHKDDDFELPF